MYTKVFLVFIFSFTLFVSGIAVAARPTLYFSVNNESGSEVTAKFSTPNFLRLPSSGEVKIPGGAQRNKVAVIEFTGLAAGKQLVTRADMKAYVGSPVSQLICEIVVSIPLQNTIVTNGFGPGYVSTKIVVQPNSNYQCMTDVSGLGKERIVKVGLKKKGGRAQ